MKRIPFLLLLSALFFSCKTETKQAKEAVDKLPNVVIIYGDDVGYADVGVYGSKLIPTPNIDKLAAGGIQFTDGHCSAATCTPSRYSLLTGIHGFRDNINILPPNVPLTIPTDAYTLPKLFKKAGYTTGVIGKWHLGIGEEDSVTDWNGKVSPGPLEIGFDYSFLLPSTNDRVPCVYLDGHRVLNYDANDPIYVSKELKDVQIEGSTQYPDGKTNREAMTYYQSTRGHDNSIINGIGRIGYMSGGKSALWNDETMTDTFIERTKTYIEAHKEEPFMLYYAAQDIHVPRAPHPRFQGKTTLGYRGDAMVQFDWAVGEILKSLEENGLTENTIVIFSSDNGPVYDDGYVDGTTVVKSEAENDRGHDASGIYTGGKYQIYEGGTRVPFIIKWPAKIQPGKSDALVNQIDLIGSFSKLLSIDIPEGEARDSRNTLDAYLGNDAKGLPFMLEETRYNRAIRVGDWKYIKGYKRGKKKFSPELYNLKQDPSEKDNIIEKHPDKAKELKKQIESLIDSNGLRI
ncbi:arylsulfatase [Flavivirga abyssicola]|uniref:sulfatase family protein n=1 Tax=Flavivirga abyssicola TaxID=3063533 RepID=UPI0026E0B15F|nr:arylsulfatase [Flavivirga sp. MEBiC07777]WVK13758.1 arylsulfatase [Flavivirga sp. MEBiC07777]